MSSAISDDLAIGIIEFIDRYLFLKYLCHTVRSILRGVRKTYHTYVYSRMHNSHYWK